MVTQCNCKHCQNTIVRDDEEEDKDDDYNLNPVDDPTDTSSDKSDHELHKGNNIDKDKLENNELDTEAAIHQGILADECNPKPVDDHSDASSDKTAKGKSEHELRTVNNQDNDLDAEFNFHDTGINYHEPEINYQEINYHNTEMDDRDTAFNNHDTEINDHYTEINYHDTEINDHESDINDHESENNDHESENNYNDTENTNSPDNSRKARIMRIQKYLENSSKIVEEDDEKDDSDIITLPQDVLYEILDIHTTIMLK